MVTTEAQLLRILTFLTDTQEAADADYSDVEMEEPDNEDTIDQEELLAVKDGIDTKVSAEELRLWMLMIVLIEE